MLLKFPIILTSSPLQRNNDHIAKESSGESDHEVQGNDQLDRRANSIW